MAPTAPRTLLSLPTTAAVLLLAAAFLAPVAANKDGDALVALKKGLQDPDNELNDWDSNSLDPCTWTRVICDDHTNRVIRLELGYLKLSGTLAPELGKLDQLKYMELHGNSIHGTIPAEFGNLNNLICMDLYNNSISAPIPTSLGKVKSLEILRVDHNRLSGPIPKELVGLSNLRIVDLSNNDLCGKIPTFGALQNIPLSSFANNPRLKGPATGGPGAYQNKC